MNKQVFVYKSNVNSPKLAKSIVMKVIEAFPKSESNFDLDDIDNIYRLETTEQQKSKIEEFLRINNVEVVELV